jgi:hypothetical protein
LNLSELYTTSASNPIDEILTKNLSFTLARSILLSVPLIVLITVSSISELDCILLTKSLPDPVGIIPIEDVLPATPFIISFNVPSPPTE